LHIVVYRREGPRIPWQCLFRSMRRDGLPRTTCSFRLHVCSMFHRCGSVAVLRWILCRILRAVRNAGPLWESDSLGGSVSEALPFCGVILRVFGDGRRIVESILIRRYFQHNVVEDGRTEFTVATPKLWRLTAAKCRRDSLALIQTETQRISCCLQDAVPVSS
jgi:hypothetical protein